jgi:hypothetical protein
MTTKQAGMNIYENEQGYLDTWGIGGDRFSFLPSTMFAPNPLVGTTTLVPEALLSIPPSYGNINMLGSGGAAGYASQGSAARAGAAAPWNPTQSIVPWVIFGLIVGLWGIHVLYYKKGKK